jgi:hypothetical protein
MAMNTAELLAVTLKQPFAVVPFTFSPAAENTATVFELSL